MAFYGITADCQHFDNKSIIRHNNIIFIYNYNMGFVYNVLRNHKYNNMETWIQVYSISSTMG